MSQTEPLLPRRWVAGAVAVAAAGLTGYALGVEPYRLGVTHPVLRLPRLPAAWEGASILFLTDPHCAGWGLREERMVALLDALDPPDLIVWGGDFLGRVSGISTAIRLVRAVGARFPGTESFAVLGNAEHKISGERRTELLCHLESAGVRVLVNGWTDVARGGTTITLAGTDDPYYGFADLEQTLAGAPPGRFTLLLAHSPQIALLAARAGVDLMLSGHTHGGQVRLPLLGALRTQNPLSRQVDCGAFDRARLARALGRDPRGDLQLYISRGIGVANIPRIEWLAPRFLCRPEIARLVLQRA